MAQAGAAFPISKGPATAVIPTPTAKRSSARREVGIKSLVVMRSTFLPGHGFFGVASPSHDAIAKSARTLRFRQCSPWSFVASSNYYRLGDLVAERQITEHALTERDRQRDTSGREVYSANLAVIDDLRSAREKA
ncbi:hypothetical protein [Nocardia sp. NPDC004750]